MITTENCQAFLKMIFSVPSVFSVVKHLNSSKERPACDN